MTTNQLTEKIRAVRVLLKLVNDLLQPMQRKNETVLIALDLSAAFDTTDHPILLKTLNYNFGIDGTALEWIRNYLAPRDMKIKIAKSHSQTKELTFFVLQGSCLGDNFFSMYFSTISEVINPNLGLMAFADDLAILREFNPKIMTEEMQIRDILITNLTNINSWMNSVRLKMNNAKSEFIIFSNRILVSKCISDKLNTNGEAVSTSHEIKYLGAWLDSECTLKTHAKRTCAMAITNLQRIKNISKYLTVESSAKLVVSFCLSHLDYSNSILAGLPEWTIIHMQRIQSYGAKLDLGKTRYDSSKKTLKDLHWLPIRPRIKFKILTIVFKHLQVFEGRCTRVSEEPLDQMSEHNPYPLIQQHHR